jgi:hypothetical protein
MGSSRSWAADHEDDDVTCRHGTVRKYFDTCRCPGCKDDREHNERVRRLADQIRSQAYDTLSKTPIERLDWKADLMKRLVS